MTGNYPWRKKGTGILPGDVALIIPTDKTTLANLFKYSGYHTAIVGKWLGTWRDSCQSLEWSNKTRPQRSGF
jgi:arylsulfatase A-like enzyme